MKLKVLIGYNDKKLKRYVSLGEIIEVTSTRSKVLENVKDYLGRNIVERISEEDRNSKTNKLEEQPESENREPEGDNPEEEKDGLENTELEKIEEANENLDEQKQDNIEQKNSQKNNEKVEQKNVKIEEKIEEGDT